MLKLYQMLYVKPFYDEHFEHLMCQKQSLCKDVLHNRIEHEYICCDTDLVINGCF